jgi:hypothetical protein
MGRELLWLQVVASARPTQRHKALVIKACYLGDSTPSGSSSRHDSIIGTLAPSDIPKIGRSYAEASDRQGPRRGLAQRLFEFPRSRGCLSAILAMLALLEDTSGNAQRSLAAHAAMLRAKLPGILNSSPLFSFAASNDEAAFALHAARQ